jgi:hypothetical protein
MKTLLSIIFLFICLSGFSQTLTKPVRLTDSTFTITKTDAPVAKKTEYNIRFLKEQKKQITLQMNTEIALRKKEIAEVDTLIARALKMKIK